MSIYNEIKLGLEQAIEYEKGNLKAKTVTYSISPNAESYESDETKAFEQKQADK